MARAPDGRGPQRAPAAPPALPPSMRDRVPFLLYRTSEMSHSVANEMLAEMALSARRPGS